MPKDVLQMPDIFVNIYQQNIIGGLSRIAYLRIKPGSLLD